MMIEDITDKFLNISYYREHGNIDIMEISYFYDILMKEQLNLRKNILAIDDIDERKRIMNEFYDKIKNIFKLSLQSSYYYSTRIKSQLPSGYRVRFGHYFTKYLRCKALFEQSEGGRVFFTVDTLPADICEEYNITTNYDIVKNVIRSAWPVVFIELKELPVGQYREITDDTVISEECYFTLKDKNGMLAIRRDGEMDRIVVCFVHFDKDEFNFFSMSPNGKELRNYRWLTNESHE